MIGGETGFGLVLGLLFSPAFRSPYFFPFFSPWPPIFSLLFPLVRIGTNVFLRGGQGTLPFLLVPFFLSLPFFSFPLLARLSGFYVIGEM